MKIRLINKFETIVVKDHNVQPNPGLLVNISNRNLDEVELPIGVPVICLKILPVHEKQLALRHTFTNWYSSFMFSLVFS